MLKAGTIEKLAEQMAATGGNASRMRPDVLKNTVQEFNAAGEIACGLNRGGAMLTDALVFGIVCGKTMTA